MSYQTIYDNLVKAIRNEFSKIIPTATTETVESYTESVDGDYAKFVIEFADGSNVEVKIKNKAKD